MGEHGHTPGHSRNRFRSEAVVAEWERRTRIPLALAAAVFLTAYAWPILDPQLDPGWVNAASWVVWITWGLFVVDCVVRLGFSVDRWRFFRHNLLDLATVVLPPLRPLRLVRVVRVLSVLNRIAGQSLRGQVATYVVVASGLVIFIASLAVLDAERGKPGASIQTFPDALWWAFSTVTTVGYGDETRSPAPASSALSSSCSPASRSSAR